MVEFSIGYMDRTAERVETVKNSLSKRAKAVAEKLSEDFQKSSVPQKVAAQSEAEMKVDYVRVWKRA